MSKFEKINDDIILYIERGHNFVHGYFYYTALVNIKNWTEKILSIDPNFNNEKIKDEWVKMEDYKINWVKNKGKIL